MKNNYLNTKHLTIGYDQKVLLSDLDLTIKKGEMICLLGPNGVGKSTLIKTLTGSLPSLYGSILLNNKDLGEISTRELAQYVSIVLTQNISSLNLTVFDLVGMGRIPHTNWLGHLSKEDIRMIEYAMELVNMHDFSDRQIDSLSDGEKQRVFIAKALAQDTPLIILDEPTAHLDIINRVALLSLLKKLAKETQKGILLSTHELEMAIQVADKIWLIDKHNKMHKGTPEDLVLSETFGDIFKGDKIQFDLNKGTFKMQHTTHNQVALKGNGIIAYWTRQALEKEGYQVVEQGTPALEISLINKPNRIWTIKKGTKETTVKSIEELINQIKL